MSKYFHFTKAKILFIRAVVTDVHKLARVAFFAFEENFLLLQQNDKEKLKWNSRFCIFNGADKVPKASLLLLLLSSDLSFVIDWQRAQPLWIDEAGFSEAEAPVMWHRRAKIQIRPINTDLHHKSLQSMHSLSIQSIANIRQSQFSLAYEIYWFCLF